MYCKLIISAALLATLCSCGERTRGDVTRADTIALQPCPVFDSGSAMDYIGKQCSFGPRVPGTSAWSTCAEWLATTFQELGCEVERQSTSVTVYDGSTVPCTNIIARLNPENHDRVLLCAHWDTRPWADNDPDPSNHHTPVPGANDGASGVAVLLEMAHAITGFSTPLKTGVDFVCFDVEDYGTPEWADDDLNTGDTWCLGSTYWAQQATASDYKARFGILFDMVGGRGGTFSMERISEQYAAPVMQMFWHLAHQIGYGQFFPLRRGSYITDDHVPVNQIAHVPCIDIVPYHTDGPSVFGPTWHTLSDAPDNIDPNVLEAVGQTALQLLYNDN